MTPTPAGALTRPAFSACDFIATQWNSADDKAWFANTLCRFIESDFRRTLWTRRLYRRLSLCFGHIAHANSEGFWGEFFTDASGKIAFLEETLVWRCFGDPTCTYCDVELAVQTRLPSVNLLAAYRALHAAETERAERALLARLRAKYDGEPPPPQPVPPARIDHRPTRRPPTAAEQPTLL